MAFDPTSSVAYLAAAGPITAAVEAAAASVGAGMVLGGFVAGLMGSIFGWKRSVREEVMVTVSSGAGLVLAILLAAEVMMG
jgi:hypothetical protein